MSKWKCGICNSEFDNFQAQGFGGTIYCPLCYFKELYRRTKIERDEYIHLYESTLKDLDIAVKNKIELENIINEAKEECKSVIGNPEHTIVSKNGLMKLMLDTLNKGDKNE